MEKRISVRVNEGQYRTLKNFAAYYKMTDSAYMRKCLYISNIRESQEFSIINGKITEVTPEEVKQGICTLDEYYYTKGHKAEAGTHKRYIVRHFNTDDVVVYLGNGMKVYINGEQYYSANSTDLQDNGYYSNTENYFLVNTNKVIYNSEGHIANWNEAVTEIPCCEQEWHEELYDYLSKHNTSAVYPGTGDCISIDENNGGTTTPPLESIINNHTDRR